MRNPGKIKIHGCQRNDEVNTRKISIIAVSTTTTTLSTTTTRLRLPRPRFSRVTSPPVVDTERDDNTTDFNITTANPALQMENQSPFVITVSVVTPASFLFIGGLLIYIQYRRGAGLSYGCRPWERISNEVRMRRSRKAKYSDNSDEETPPPASENSETSDLETTAPVAIPVTATVEPQPQPTPVKRMLTRSQRQKKRKGNMSDADKITTIGPNSSTIMESSSENSLYSKNSVV